MVLQFENAGTCLIVKQYLDRCRNTLRRELMDRFRVFVEPDIQERCQGSTENDKHENGVDDVAKKEISMTQKDTHSSEQVDTEQAVDNDEEPVGDSDYETASERGGVSSDSYSKEDGCAEEIKKGPEQSKVSSEKVDEEEQNSIDNDNEESAISEEDIPVIKPV